MNNDQVSYQFSTTGSSYPIEHSFPDDQGNQKLPHVYIILVNWNGWLDTIECLESVFRLDYPCFTVIVCDNASSDDSLLKIEAWASGSLVSQCRNSQLNWLSMPPITKPLPFRPFSDSEMRSGPTSARLLLIQAGNNLGFAGGNNLGIRYALSRGDCDYVWLLNNDTVVDPHALSAMIEMTENNTKIGICGSQLRSYFRPSEIQTMGGRRYIPWTGRTSPLTAMDTPCLSTISGAPDYIEGASMLIRKNCLCDVGLLEEGYFLYYEELDFVERAHASFVHGFAVKSIVYHKEGASIGTASVRTKRSTLSEFYQTRNRIKFTWKYHPWCLATVSATVGLSILQRILIGKPQNAISIVRGAFSSFVPVSF